MTVTASLRPLGQQGLLFRALSEPAWQETLKTVTLEYKQQPEIVHWLLAVCLKPAGFNGRSCISGLVWTTEAVKSFC